MSIIFAKPSTKRAALTAWILVFLLNPALAASPDPTVPIAAIYAKAAAGKGDSGGQFVYLTKKDRPRWLSKSLTKLWNAGDDATPKGDENPPGFDPVSNSQDPKVRNVKVELEKSDSKTATVAASFDSWSRGNTAQEQDRNPPDPRDRITVRYDMVLENGPKGPTWKIDEIRGLTDGKEWSIRTILKHFNGD